jgi:hypothetical protein
MRLRRASRVLTAAAIAAAASGAGLTSAPGAYASGTVGIVISMGGGINVARCVAAGPSGDDIVNEVASVAYRPRDGIITQIDNYPAADLGTDTTHYWAYFHNTGAGWTYSNVGASGYTPAAGTVEGWRYDDGQDPAPEPPAVSYASICAQAVAPPPVTPSRVITPSPKTTAAQTHPATATSQAAGTSGAPTSSAVSNMPTASATVPVPSRPAVTNTSLSSIDATSVSRASDSRKGSSGSYAAVIIGVLLVVALAGGTVVVALRRRAG